MTEILIAIVCGFIGGVLASMILHETLETLYAKKMHEDEQTHEELQKKVENIDAQYKAVTVALQELTYKFVRERGALWESVNGLWKDYDDRHKQTEPEKEPEPEQTTSQTSKKAATGTKQKKTKENS